MVLPQHRSLLLASEQEFLLVLPPRGSGSSNPKPPPDFQTAGEAVNVMAGGQRD